MRERASLSPALGQKGVLHLPLALLAVALILTGLALWGLLHRWKSLTQTQLRLDRCTGEAALELKGKLTKIQSINDQMVKLRALEAAASAVTPQAETALMIAVNAEALRQEAVRADWLLTSGRWAAGAYGNCGERGDLRAPLPTLGWHRDPPDSLGERPLRLEELPRSFYFEVKHAPRGSAAEVFLGGQNGNTFHARWVTPHELLRPSIH